MSEEFYDLITQIVNIALNLIYSAHFHLNFLLLDWTRVALHDSLFI